MERATCMRVGGVSRLHGYKGELSLKFDYDLPFDYTSIDILFLDINEKLVPYFIDSIRFTPQGFGLAQLNGVDNEERARKLVGTDIFLPRAELPEMDNEEYILRELVGFHVMDKEYGELGEVAEVIEHPGNILLRIEGENGDILIPFIEQFVLEVDKTKALIRVLTPEGLIDLNRSGSE